MCTIEAFQPILDGSAGIALNVAPHIYRCHADWRWDVPPLPDYDLWCVLGGEGRFFLPERQLSLFAGVCLVIPPGCRPLAEHNPRNPLCVFAIHFEAINVASPPTGILVQHVRDIPFLTMLAEHCEEAGQHLDSVQMLQAVSLVHEILLLLAVEHERETKYESHHEIEGIIEQIRHEPQRQWSLTEVARRACLSRSQVTRHFHQLTGLAPIEFIISVRLIRACNLLIETRLSVKAIAAAVGYENSHYFSRQFHCKFGMSPSHYRSSGM
jgi:AraC-like DNA-binding protein